MARRSTLSSRPGFGAPGAWLAAVLCGTTLLTGCGSFSDLVGRRQMATNQQVSVDNSTITVYLADVATLLSEDNAAAARAWRELELDYERAPTTTNQLRLALAKATPGHAHTDFAAADSMLTSLLMKPELLLGDEQLLARVHLGLLRDRISTESVARQASSSASRNAERELATARAQLSLLQQDNTRLRKALAETEDKLRAITLIERSIREREDEPTGDGSQPARGQDNE